jgi:hypothetical protein
VKLAFCQIFDVGRHGSRPGGRFSVERSLLTEGFLDRLAGSPFEVFVHGQVSSTCGPSFMGFRTEGASLGKAGSAAGEGTQYRRMKTGHGRRHESEDRKSKNKTDEPRENE